jgi:hypothetical protein
MFNNTLQGVGGNKKAFDTASYFKKIRGDIYI